MSKITNIIKRSGAVVPFNPERITNAIYRAAVAVGGRDKEKAAQLSAKVVEYLENNCAEGCTPQIEEIQDLEQKLCGRLWKQRGSDTLPALPHSS